MISDIGCRGIAETKHLADLRRRERRGRGKLFNPHSALAHGNRGQNRTMALVLGSHTGTALTSVSAEGSDEKERQGRARTPDNKRPRDRAKDLHRASFSSVVDLSRCLQND